MACGFGSLALADLLSAGGNRPLTGLGSPHHAPKAKRVIFIFMQGGPPRRMGAVLSDAVRVRGFSVCELTRMGNRMTTKLRFTGELPPPDLWKRYPNWTCALEEEGLDGQDESTLRPSKNQKTIDWEVDWTAADVVFANGDTAPALVQFDEGELNWIHVYPDPKRNKAWVVWFSGPKRRCVAINKYWGGRRKNLAVPIGDVDVFPLLITTRLRYKRKQVVLNVKEAHKQ
jgi:hypothetical protein